MKLSLSILKEQLKSSVKQFNLGKKSLILNLPRPIFYTGESIMESNTLYISTAHSLPKQIKLMEDSALICISTPPENYFHSNLNLLIFHDTWDLFHLSNTIHKIYDDYDHWDISLQQSTSVLNPLQYMIDKSEPIFGNGISIMDRDYYVISQTKLNLEAKDYEGLDENGYIPIEQVNAFKNDKRYMEIMNEKEVFFYPNEVLPYKCICKNIFINDEFIFRIIVSQTTKELSENDSVLLEYISTYFEQVANHINTLHQEENSFLSSLMKNIIEGNSYNQATFNKELNKIGWSHEDSYRILQIQTSSHDIRSTTMSYFCNKIMREFSQTQAFIKDYFIIVIVNIAKLSESKDNFFTKFNYFIREGNFRVGFSNYSIGLYNLREYFLQANIALEMGLLQQPTKWSHQFSDNVFPYIMGKITEELPANFLYSPVITRLQQYDLENQTDYLNTLKIYMNNQMNAVQTAKDLFIHRATIVYRLERIKEIGKTDLKNRDELLHINLSFELLENTKS